MKDHFLNIFISLLKFVSPSDKPTGEVPGDAISDVFGGGNTDGLVSLDDPGGSDLLFPSVGSTGDVMDNVDKNDLGSDSTNDLALHLCRFKAAVLLNLGIHDGCTVVTTTNFPRKLRH